MDVSVLGGLTMRNEHDVIYISRPGYGFIWLDRESAKEVRNQLNLWEETVMRNERHSGH